MCGSCATTWSSCSILMPSAFGRTPAVLVLVHAALLREAIER
jgi:hypothetical protein